MLAVVAEGSPDRTDHTVSVRVRVLECMLLLAVHHGIVAQCISDLSTLIVSVCCTYEYYYGSLQRQRSYLLRE